MHVNVRADISGFSPGSKQYVVGSQFRIGQRRASWRAFSALITNPTATAILVLNPL